MNSMNSYEQFFQVFPIWNFTQKNPGKPFITLHTLHADKEMTTMAIAIKIERIKPIKDRGSLPASVDLRISKTLFRSWWIIQQEGKRPWVSPPVESGETSDGERRYKASRRCGSSGVAGERRAS